MTRVVVKWGRHIGGWACCFGVIGFSHCIAWLLRFDFSIPAAELPVFRYGLVLALVSKGLVFYGLRLRLDQWPRYLGFSDLVELLQANVLGSGLACAALYSVVGPAFPRSVCCLDLLVCVVVGGGMRFAARLFYEVRARLSSTGSAKGLLIYGAGVAGLALAREIRGNPGLGYQVVGFIDDDPRKVGARLLGLPVLGCGDDVRAIVEAHRHRYPAVQEVVVAMPSATGRQIRTALEKGRSAGVPCRIVPGLGELISGKLAVGNPREISVTDLLSREPVQLDQNRVRRMLEGRSVLVTGAAGSIGSELCNQLAELGPKYLIALDQAESELFRLEADLRLRHPGLSLAAEIGDIRDGRRIEKILEAYAVNWVFHAAAYKHVPLMERHVCEAVRNNVIGTWNLVQAAWRSNVFRFLMISTDKAVNPSSIMGLTKRAAELITSAARPAVGRGPATCCVCVRFGNVLVSNGSVVPIFEKQIAAGGPVTVTHPDIRRYFMTVQEAVQLVLQASTMGKGSEIFVLEMGKPVRIADMARKMITLAGLVPDQDIEIQYVGLRPGEKLFEELSLNAENVLPTSHEKIHVFQNRTVPLDELVPWIAELQHLLWRRDPEAVIAHLRLLVPEYQSPAARIPVAMEPAVAPPRAAGAAVEAY